MLLNVIPYTKTNCVFAMVSEINSKLYFLYYFITFYADISNKSTKRNKMF